VRKEIDGRGKRGNQKREKGTTKSVRNTIKVKRKTGLVRGIGRKRNTGKLNERKKELNRIEEGEKDMAISNTEKGNAKK
jgi:hypothetical protein